MACYVNNHPLVQDALATLRRTTTTTEQFRKATKRISHLLIAETTRNIRINPIKVETSLGIADGFTIASDVVFVPILRAGLGMLEVALELIPAAIPVHIGHIVAVNPSPRDNSRRPPRCPRAPEPSPAHIPGTAPHKSCQAHRGLR